MNELAAGSWLDLTDVRPGGPSAQGIEGDGFSVAYSWLPAGAIFVAAVNTDPRQLRVREVTDWSRYDLDATTQFPLSALNRDVPRSSR